MTTSSRSVMAAVAIAMSPQTHKPTSRALAREQNLVGIMNEFSRLAEVYRDHDPRPDLIGVAQRLTTTPCSPLYGRSVSPDRELAAFLRTITP